jgi:hypothetical protein
MGGKMDKEAVVGKPEAGRPVGGVWIILLCAGAQWRQNRVLWNVRVAAAGKAGVLLGCGGER